jgi:hypothetical protein
MMKDVAYLLVPIVGVPVERSGFSDVENGGSSRGLLNHESILAAAGRAQNENTNENARTPAQSSQYVYYIVGLRSAKTGHREADLFSLPPGFNASSQVDTQ